LSDLHIAKKTRRRQPQDRLRPRAVESSLDRWASLKASIRPRPRPARTTRSLAVARHDDGTLSIEPVPAPGRLPRRPAGRAAAGPELGAQQGAGRRRVWRRRVKKEADEGQDAGRPRPPKQGRGRTRKGRARTSEPNSRADVKLERQKGRLGRGPGARRRRDPRARNERLASPPALGRSAGSRREGSNLALQGTLRHAAGSEACELQGRARHRGLAGIRRSTASPFEWRNFHGRSIVDAKKGKPEGSVKLDIGPRSPARRDSAQGGARRLEGLRGSKARRDPSTYTGNRTPPRGGCSSRSPGEVQLSVDARDTA